jgi:hypothetical protein
MQSNGLRRNGYHTGMTALASQCTKEGFAIGADSLRMDMHGKIVTERAVKIYETGHLDFVGAYGFAGMTAFEFADGRILDVLESAKAVAAGLLAERFGSAEEYADRFCNKLAADIQAGCAGAAIPHSFRLREMFLGPSRGQGAYIEMGFPFINGYLLRPVLAESFVNPVDRYCILSGSRVVLDEMHEHVGGPETLEQATEWVRDYITRCINNTTDPYCKNVGGKAQVATVTLDKGFSWVAAPLNPLHHRRSGFHFEADPEGGVDAFLGIGTFAFLDIFFRLLDAEMAHPTPGPCEYPFQHGAPRSQTTPELMQVS